MKRKSIVYIFLVVFISLFVCVRAGESKTEVLISGAASLTDVLREISANYEKQHFDVRVLLNLGSTGELELQIRHGAKADIFAGAAPVNVERLGQEGLLTSGTIQVWCRNRMTLLVRSELSGKIRAASGATTYSKLLDESFRRIAVGDPKSVPAGQYAQKLLMKHALWEKLGPKFVFASNVRQALTWVEQGEVDAAFVYLTDARTAHKAVAVATTTPDELKIEYAIALTKIGGEHAVARDLFAFMTDMQGNQVLESHGFLSPAGSTMNSK